MRLGCTNNQRNFDFGAVLSTTCIFAAADEYPYRQLSSLCLQQPGGGFPAPRTKAAQQLHRGMHNNTHI